jgi:hypothetical protein
MATLAWHAAAETDNLEVLETLWIWAKEVNLKPGELSTLLLAKDCVARSSSSRKVQITG